MHELLPFKSWKCKIIRGTYLSLYLVLFIRGMWLSRLLHGATQLWTSAELAWATRHSGYNTHSGPSLIRANIMFWSLRNSSRSGRGQSNDFLPESGPGVTVMTPRSKRRRQWAGGSKSTLKGSPEVGGGLKGWSVGGRDRENMEMLYPETSLPLRSKINKTMFR